MSDHLRISQLNNLLINLDKSLLQYAGESWLWTSLDDEESRDVLNSMVAKQKSNAEAVLEILITRRWEIDRGTYPTEYTDLHYVAFDYLATEIAKNEELIKQSAQETLSVFSDDEEVKSVLERILHDTESNIEQLKKVGTAG